MFHINTNIKIILLILKTQAKPYDKTTHSTTVNITTQQKTDELTLLCKSKHNNRKTLK